MPRTKTCTSVGTVGKRGYDKQIKTAAGAKSYIQRNRDHIFLDPKGATPFPLKIPKSDLHIHKIIVAHGAKEACLRFSAANVSGSLGICYGAAADRDFPWPFLVSLDKEDPVHLFDSHNLEIMLTEPDTLHDLKAYLEAKEKAIQNFPVTIARQDLSATSFCLARARACTARELRLHASINVRGSGRTIKRDYFICSFDQASTLVLIRLFCNWSKIDLTRESILPVQDKSNVWIAV